MSQTLSAPLQKPQSPGRSFAFPVPVVVAVVALALAHVPLLMAHLHVLSLKPHYEFYPLVFVGAGGARLAGDQDVPRPATGRGRPNGRSGWACSRSTGSCSPTAVVLDSPWLGMVSFWELLAAVALLAGG